MHSPRSKAKVIADLKPTKQHHGNLHTPITPYIHLQSYITDCLRLILPAGHLSNTLVFCSIPSHARSQNTESQ